MVVATPYYNYLHCRCNHLSSVCPSQICQRNLYRVKDNTNQTRIFVGYPRIAQNDVDKSTLDITSMAISNPSPDSFHLAQAQIIGSKSTFHPVLYSFGAAVSLAGSFSPFGSVTVPQVKAKDGVRVNIDQDVRLSDRDAFMGFAKTALLNESVSLNVHGKPKLRLGALQKVGVTYDKTVRVKGIYSPIPLCLR